MARRTARVEGHVDDAVDMPRSVDDADVVRADHRCVARFAIGELRMWRRWRRAVTRRATERSFGNPARRRIVLRRARTMTPSVCAAQKRAVPARLVPATGSNPQECDLGAETLRMPYGVGGVGDVVALGAGERTTERAAGQMDAVRADAGRARRAVAERVWRWRRVVALAVTGAAIRRAGLHDAVDVQGRRDELASGVDHVAMTRFAAPRLGMGRRGGEAVASPAGGFRRARLGPHGIGVFAVTRAVRTRPSLRVVAGVSPAAASQRSEHQLGGASAICVANRIAATRNVVALAARDGAVRLARVEVNAVRTDSGVTGARGAK